MKYNYNGDGITLVIGGVVKNIYRGDVVEMTLGDVPAHLRGVDFHEVKEATPVQAVKPAAPKSKPKKKKKKDGV
jgi:hypothetical protein